MQPSIPQPPFQLFPVRRKDEDAHRFWNLLLYLTRSLHIDVQQQVVTSVFRFPQKTPRRAVIVAENSRVLQKLVGRNHGFEFFAGYKKIFLAILLAPAR